jgi:hypothetical protein
MPKCIFSTLDILTNSSKKALLEFTYSGKTMEFIVLVKDLGDEVIPKEIEVSINKTIDRYLNSSEHCKRKIKNIEGFIEDVILLYKAQDPRVVIKKMVE